MYVGLRLEVPVGSQVDHSLAHTLPMLKGVEDLPVILGRLLGTPTTNLLLGFLLIFHSPCFIFFLSFTYVHLRLEREALLR